MGVNYRVLRLEISNQAEKVILPRIKPLIKQEFESKKEIMLQEFDNHGVTRELKAGSTDSTAPSSYIKTRKGGNLFSLLGFEAGTDPTEAVREILNKDVKLNLSQITKEVGSNNIVFKTPIRIPTLDTIHEKVAQKSPTPWTSRAFTDAIERGITGFGKYLFDATRHFKASRSGPAIQIDATLREGSTPRIKYISQIIANFKSLIKGN